MLRIFLIPFFLLFFLDAKASAQCKANLFADDWNGELRTVNDVNTWCSQRANWYHVDTSKYDSSKYCFSSKEVRYDSYGRQYYVYPTLFWWYLRSFDGGYQDDVLVGISEYLRGFSFKGWPSSVKIKFEPSC